MDAGGTARPRGATARTIAQAKLNLLLRILAREASGYHQLETVFCRLALGDDVVVRTNARGRALECTGDAMPDGGLGPTEENLAWRAAVRYAAATGWPNAWAIEIVKHVPVGGGLGGGSADAGAVLRCLNALSPSPISPSALLELAAPLGADVPFLTTEAPLALAWGRGERLLTLPPLARRNVALACFPFGVSTRDAYAWLDARTADEPRSAAIDGATLGRWDEVARLAHNDFEAVVAPRVPPIAAALAAFRSSDATKRDPAAITVLAGSGATVAMISDAPWSDIWPTHGVPSRRVETTTANHVVAVEVSD
jgi:4-diphosphocytidyl-2-C-methyl-D-erythritol kinase